MRYFLDNNFSPAYVQMLAAMEVDLIHLCQHFVDRAVKDIVWMPEVARLGWVAITQDRGIERRPHEAQVRRQSKLRMIYFPRAFMKMAKWDQAAFLVRKWPEIEVVAPTMQEGQGLLLPLRGRWKKV